MSPVRNLSLAGNVLLAMGLVVAGGLLWKTRDQQSALRTAVADGQRTVARYETFITSVMSANAYVGMSFPKLELRNVEGTPVSTDFSGRKGALVLLFKPQSCQPCLITQLKALQHLHAVLEEPEAFPIIGFSSAGSAHVKGFTRAFELDYDLVSDASILMDEGELARQTPVVFLVDSQNQIWMAHVPSPGRPEFSILFYNQVRAHQMERSLKVSLDHDRASFGLGGVPFVKVVRDEYDKGRVRDLLY